MGRGTGVCAELKRRKHRLSNRENQPNRCSECGRVGSLVYENKIGELCIGRKSGFKRIAGIRFCISCGILFDEGREEIGTDDKLEGGIHQTDA